MVLDGHNLRNITRQLCVEVHTRIKTMHKQHSISNWNTYAFCYAQTTDWYSTNDGTGSGTVARVYEEAMWWYIPTGAAAGTTGTTGSTGIRTTAAATGTTGIRTTGTTGSTGIRTTGAAAGTTTTGTTGPVGTTGTIGASATTAQTESSTSATSSTTTQATSSTLSTALQENSAASGSSFPMNSSNIGIIFGGVAGLLLISVVIVCVVKSRKRDGSAYKSPANESSSSAYTQQRTVPLQEIPQFSPVQPQVKPSPQVFPAPSSTTPAYVSRTPPPPPKWRQGDMVMSKWSGDGQYYRARIDAVNVNNYLVNYVDFGTTEWRHATDLNNK